MGTNKTEPQNIHSVSDIRWFDYYIFIAVIVYI